MSTQTIQERPDRPLRIALIGDSILDNKRYTAGEPSVCEHLNDILGDNGSAVNLAVDGSLTHQVAAQFGRIPAETTHVVLSSGGNDALQYEHLLSQPVLYAALDVMTGAVIGDCNETHKGEDFIAFLRLIHRKTPKGKTLHIIADTCSAHKTKQVKEYIVSGNGRFVLHFIPTHSSWLNLVERFFAEITNKRIRRGSWTGKKQLEKAIMDFIHEWNESKRRFVWTKTSDEITAKINRAKSY